MPQEVGACRCEQHCWLRNFTASLTNTTCQGLVHSWNEVFRTVQAICLLSFVKAFTEGPGSMLQMTYADNWVDTSKTKLGNAGSAQHAMFASDAGLMPARTVVHSQSGPSYPAMDSMQTKRHSESTHALGKHTHFNTPRRDVERAQHLQILHTSNSWELGSILPSSIPTGGTAACNAISYNLCTEVLRRIASRLAFLLLEAARSLRSRMKASLKLTR
eukprot:6215993-Amphidinium_carterae.1